MMRKFWLSLFLLAPLAGHAQSVQQSGNITPGHSACWAITGVIYDCGLPAGSSILGSYTANDLVAVNGSGSLIDSGINPLSTSNITGLWNFNGGATAPTRSPGDNTTNLATTAFVNNILTGASIWTGTPNFTAGIACTITANPLGMCFNTLQATAGGSYSGPTNMNYIAISENLAGTTNFLNGFTIQSNAASGGGGGRQTFVVDMQLTGWNATRGNEFAVAGSFLAQVSANAGGTSPSHAGAVFALGGTVQLRSGSTFYNSAVTQENDVEIDTGASVNYLTGMSIVQLAAHAVHATIQESALVFSNQGGAIGWNNLILIGNWNSVGASPLAASGACVMCLVGDPGFMFGINFVQSNPQGTDLSAGYPFTSGTAGTANFSVDWGGRIRTGGTDGEPPWLMGYGATNGIRFFSDGSGSYIEGVNAAANAFEPISIGGLKLNFTSSGTPVADYNSTTTNTWSIGITTPVKISSAGVFTAQNQIITTFGTPTIASGACGATTNGAVTGVNQSGLVTIGSATTTTCTVSFSTTIAAPNSCVIFPANAAAAAQGTTVARVSSVGTTNFVITGSALANSNYYYLCI